MLCLIPERFDWLSYDSAGKFFSYINTTFSCFLEHVLVYVCSLNFCIVGTFGECSIFKLVTLSRGSFFYEIVTSVVYSGHSMW